MCIAALLVSLWAVRSVAAKLLLKVKAAKGRAGFGVSDFSKHHVRWQGIETNCYQNKLFPSNFSCKTGKKNPGASEVERTSGIEAEGTNR